MGGGKVVPEDTQQSQPRIPVVRVDRSQSTSSSQPLGGISGNNVQGYGASNMGGPYI